MRRTLRFLGGALVAFTACFVVLELFLRVTGAAPPSFVMDDARFGRTFRPGAALTLVNEGFYLGRVNEYGYLGPAYQPGNTPGVLRIALLGDSFVEGFQVFERHHFRTLLERELNGDPSRKVQVLNFGFSGFNFPRMADYALEAVKDYEPDLVLFFVGIDDFLQPASEIGPGFRAVDDSLVVDLSFTQTDTFRRKLALSASRNFSFYTLVRKTWQMAEQGRTGVILFEKLHPDWGKPAPEIDWAQETDKLDPNRDRVNRLLLERLGRWNRNGTKVALVVKRPIGEHYTRLARENGIPILDPTPALEELRRRGIDPNWWPVTSQRGHWNQPAHAAIAHFLSPRIRELAGAIR